MRRQARLYVEDVLRAIERIEAFAEGMGAEDFARDEKTQFAVLRALEIMGEAAKHVPPEVRARVPAVPWREMAELRDVLIHAYFGVDLAIVWRTIHERLPDAKAHVRHLLDTWPAPERM